MSDDFTNIKTFVTELMTSLKTSITHTAADGTGGLFPNGVNDIYAKIAIGDVRFELEISSADVIHSDAGAGSPKPVEPPDGISVYYAVRPMEVTLANCEDNGPVLINTSFHSQSAHKILACGFQLKGPGKYTLDIANNTIINSSP